MGKEHADTLRFAVSATAMSTIEGSEIYYSPERYDGGSQGAKDAFPALRAAMPRHVGKGISYTVETTREGAVAIEEYCRCVGEGFMSESEPDIRVEGRALLVVADRIKRLLG